MNNTYLKSKIEGSTLKVGGSQRKLWWGETIKELGNKITKWGSDIITRSKPHLVTNPSVKLINAFTLLINFTVDTNQKYQVILQGDYKEKYKESKENDDNVSLTQEDLFIIIYQSQRDWFRKE